MFALAKQLQGGWNPTEPSPSGPKGSRERYHQVTITALTQMTALHLGKIADSLRLPETDDAPGGLRDVCERNCSPHEEKSITHPLELAYCLSVGGCNYFMTT